MDIRNGKIPGLPKEEATTLKEAAIAFYPLARLGHIKAMHNLAMTYYKQEQYFLAFKWFKQAADKEFIPSINNLVEMQSHGLIQKAWLGGEVIKAVDDRIMGLRPQITLAGQNKDKALALETLNKMGTFVLQKDFDVIEAFLFRLSEAVSAINNGHTEGFHEFNPPTSFKNAWEVFAIFEESLPKAGLRQKDILNFGIKFIEDYYARFPKSQSLLHLFKFYSCQKIDKVQGIWPPVFNIENNFYDREKAKHYLYELLLRLQSGQDEYNNFVDYYLQTESATLRPVDTKISEEWLPIINKRLAEIGDPFYKLKYALTIANKGLSEEEYPDLDPELEAFEKRLEVNGIEHLYINLQDLSIEDRSQLEALWAQEDHKGNQKLQAKYTPWLEKAFNQLIDTGTLQDLIDYYLTVKNRYGFITFKSQSQPKSVLVDLGRVGFNVGYPAVDPINYNPYLQRLKDIIVQKGIALEMKGAEVKIVPARPLTLAQRKIIAPIIVQDPKGFLMIGGQSWGGNEIVVNENGLYAGMEGLKFDIGNFTSHGHLVTPGPALIVAKQLTLSGTVDARQGGIYIAEKFDIDPDTIITMPSWQHFLKIDDIKRTLALFQ